MYLYEIYLTDGYDYGGDYKLMSKTKYSQEQFENIVSKAKSMCDSDEYDGEFIDKLAKVLLNNWDFIEIDCILVNVIDV